MQDETWIYKVVLNKNTMDVNYSYLKFSNFCQQVDFAGTVYSLDKWVSDCEIQLTTFYLSNIKK